MTIGAWRTGYCVVNGFRQFYRDYDRIEYDVLNRVYEKYLSHLPPARTVWSVQIESGFKVQLDAVAVA